MELRIFVEPQQGATYDDLLRVALATERLGFGAFFRSDHYLAMGDSTDGLPGPTDAWITLAGLARETSTIRLGTLLTAGTFRHPGPLAIAVAQVDQMSGGRVEFGLGAGWFETEHAAYGIPFPATVDERLDRLAEQLELIAGMWGTPVGERYSFAGEYYTLTDCPALAKPVQQRVPVIVGGRGPVRTPAIAARYATEFNLAFRGVADTAAQVDRVRAACVAIDRDPDSMVYSGGQILVCGRDEAEIARRAAAVGREVPELRENGLTGTPDEVIAKLEEFRAAGVSRMYLQVLDLDDLDHLELVAAEVMPKL